MTTGKKTSVKVTIVGEEYAIRSDATPEHTRDVADFVDRVIRDVMGTGTVIEKHKAAILAAMQIADELFRARQAERETTAAIRGLSADVRRWLPPAKRGEVQAP